jgi:hypothetical protein
MVVAYSSPGFAGGAVTIPIGVVLRSATPRRSRGLQGESYFKSTVQYALSRKFFQLAYLGLPSLIVSIGLRFGRTGF